MRRSVAEVFARLRAEGLATGEDEARARSGLGKDRDDDMPWYVRVAVGIGAWVATGFFLGFLFQILDTDSVGIRLVYGTLLIGLGVFVRGRTGSEFLKHASIAASLAGQALIVATVGDALGDAEAAATALALSVLLIPLMPDQLHRFVGGVVAGGALTVFLVELEISRALALATLGVLAAGGWVWRGRLARRDARTTRLLQPVGYGLVVALFSIMLTSAVMGVTAIQEVTRNNRVASAGPIATIGIILALIILVWKIFDEHGARHESGTSFAAILGAAALGVSAYSSPGIVAGVTVLMLAFDRRDAVLLGKAVIFLLVFASFYYYNLELTLLEKSGVLVGTGLLLIAIRGRIAPSGGAEARVR
jgi:hypothetical protein